MKIRHVIPSIGAKDIPLYSPANQLYELLYREKEVARLNRLRHLGSLSHALPGVRHMRWDYTVAMLHFASQLSLRGGGAGFRIGGVDFSSLASAIQCIALAWNIGHVPGTFSVEKGVSRYLKAAHPRNPCDGLNWPSSTKEERKVLRSRANEYFHEQGYLGLSRILAVKKLLSMRPRHDESFQMLVWDFLIPFLLDFEDLSVEKWRRIGDGFVVVRHAAYLSVDHAFSGVEWAPQIGLILRDKFENIDGVADLSAAVSEALSPIEREIYHRIYHCEEARVETAVVANHVQKKLGSMPPEGAASRIDRWLTKGLSRELKLGRIPRQSPYVVSATVTLRSHLPRGVRSPEDLEQELERRISPLPVVSEYRAWNSDELIEPDELTIDCVSKERATTEDVGRLIAWCVDNLDDTSAKVNDVIHRFRRRELDKSYEELVGRVVGLAFPGVQIRVDPWPLESFGVGDSDSPVPIRFWGADGQLNCHVVRHVLRNRSGNIPSRLAALYAELMGLRALRLQLRKKWKKHPPRQRCLLVTASVRFSREGLDLIEYDGGILTASVRGGRMIWYGLETKSRKTDPTRSLERKLKTLGFPGSIDYVPGTNNNTAAVRLELRNAS